MRISHISDTHGKFPIIDNTAHYIIHSGDFFPNSEAIFADKRIEEARFQKEWLKSQLYNLKEKIGNKEFLFISGNHDFVPGDEMEEILKSAAIKAICLNDKVVSFAGLTFYGFPYITAIKGRWNYECLVPEMERHCRELIDNISANKVDVIVAHSPLHILNLAFDGRDCGNPILASKLFYQNELAVKYYLCGHCHEGHGIAIDNGILFSNAATVQHIIEY